MPQVCFAVRVFCTTVALAGAPLLVAIPARAQSIPSADRAVAVGAATGSVQPAPVTRQWRNDWFRDRDYFDPLIAEPRAPQIAFTFPAWIPELEFSVEPGNRLAWEVSLGREIPIFTRANFDDATRGLKGSQGFGVWVDVSFHMLEDMGKDPSNPIINTDYRFSLAKLKYYRVISVSPPTTGPNPVRRWKSLAFRADLYHHESTHLGDEFVINGQGAHPGEFERQNVSFEFYDITGAFNWERGDGLKHSIRGGTTGLVNPSNGYYSDHTLEFPGSRSATSPSPSATSNPTFSTSSSRHTAPRTLSIRSARLAVAPCQGQHCRAVPARSSARRAGRPSCRWTSGSGSCSISRRRARTSRRTRSGRSTCLVGSARSPATSGSRSKRSTCATTTA